MLSLVLPTYNEAKNLPLLLPQIIVALAHLPHEVIVVDDDSPDETWRVAQSLTREHPALRVLRRIGRRGLASAVVEGCALARGDVLAVMDADGQHDPRVLVALHRAIQEGAGIAVASRYRRGGRVDRFAGGRLLISRAATLIARLFCGIRVSDPLSGFFALDRTLFQRIQPHLHPRGFKILLEILTHLPRDVRIDEIPLVFGVRRFGESKLTAGVHLQFLHSLLEAAVRRRGPIIFWGSVLLTSFVLVPHLRLLSPLYTNAEVRQKFSRAVEQFAEEEGYLLSDLSLLSIRPDRATIDVRVHRRGSDPLGCIMLSLVDPLVNEPCH